MDYVEEVYKLSLPKCGNKRNVLENYKVTEKQLLDEDECIKTLIASSYELDRQEALKKLLSNHPFPLHQGPFEKHISSLQYDYEGDAKDGDSYTFYSYTTFVHEKKNDPCKLWSINSKQMPGEPKHILTFTTEDVKDGLTLWGPASNLEMAIMYNCNEHKCVIMCPCTVCEVNPSKSQCLTHYVDLQRKFNLKDHSFTIPCSSNKLLPLYQDKIKKRDEFHTGHTYAGIPRSCLQCRLDLLDHQSHHHVLHQQCKFCAVVLRILDRDETMNNIRKAYKDIERIDNSTCSFCYKVFTTHANRVLHERTEHEYINLRDLKRPGATSYNSEMYNKSLRLLDCSECTLSYGDNIQASIG